LGKVGAHLRELPRTRLGPILLRPASMAAAVFDLLAAAAGARGIAAKLPTRQSPGHLSELAGTVHRDGRLRGRSSPICPGQKRRGSEHTRVDEVKDRPEVGEPVFNGGAREGNPGPRLFRIRILDRLRRVNSGASSGASSDSVTARRPCGVSVRARRNPTIVFSLCGQSDGSQKQTCCKQGWIRCRKNLYCLRQPGNDSDLPAHIPLVFSTGNAPQPDVVLILSAGLARGSLPL